ncbi:MAG: tetratricopeptide repeat protein [Gammaproteobacteria bacterium]|nr:tetratricopeptide repeat protein [Gammaproteobacteria bacterium]
MEEVFEFAKQMQAAGNFTDAETCYRRYLEDNENSFKALNNLGVVLECQDKLVDAVECFRKAAELVPEDPIPRYNLGHAYFRQERLDSAADLFEALLEENPDHGPACLNLGVIYWRQDRLIEAEKLLRRATHYSEVAANANSKLGLFLFDCERFVEARSCHLAAAAIEESPHHYFQAALCDRTLGLHDEAADKLATAQKLDPESRTLFEHRTRALLAAGDTAAVEATFREWESTLPNDPICAHMLAAFRGDNSVARCSTDYVRETFSGFAGDFNETLERLEYGAPQAIADAFQTLQTGQSQFTCILDAGCGTGLCGPLVRAGTQNLVGVDLAQPMLDKAQLLGAYDELIEADLVDYMATQNQKFDAILAADTYNYFGELQTVFAAAANALTPGGHMIFTLEQCSDDTSGFRLMPHGRFEHEMSYVETVLTDNGFAMASVDALVLRKEGGEDVNGWLIMARGN